MSIRCTWAMGLGMAIGLVAWSAAALGTAQQVVHTPGQQVFGEPSGVTMREPEISREGEAVDIYFQVAYSFDYQNVAVYYTTDGTIPSGNGGVPQGGTSTQVATNGNGGAVFVRNEFDSGANRNRDWWRVRLPASARQFGQTIQYKISAFGNGPEVYTNGANTNALANTYSFTNKIAWPGAGAGAGNPAIGYPGVSFWKEEGVVGNNWINSMLDQNGTWFDMYFPGAGGVYGVSTKAEGYASGLDTFPPNLPADRRGQMHLNQAMVGLRVNGLTHWLSNPAGVSFDQITQSYVGDTQTIRTTQRLFAGGSNIQVEQYDFAPKGVTYASSGNRSVLIKRVILTNPGPSAQTVDLYLYLDPALNGSDNYDAMFLDSSTGAMVAFDNTLRTVTGTGCCFPNSNEYNPTTFSGYEKNVSVYLAGAMKVLPSVGAAGGTLSSDSWRDSSGDNGQGWIGQRVSLPPNTPVEVNFLFVGGFDNFAGATGTYNAQMKPAVQWFQAESAQALQATTDAFWTNFVNSGVTVNTPDARLNTLFKRGVLGTMLHFDERNGGLIAGFRNGAYPYVWPRDMAWAAVTLSRVGQLDTVRSMTRYLRDITFRDFETWTPGNTPGFAAAGGSPFYGTRKGFWKQKYTTDGYVVWGAPQVDETAVFPWMVKYFYDMTADQGYLNEAQVGNPTNTTYAAVKDAAIAMSQTTTIDGTRLNHRASYPGSSSFLMYSNNIWEDQYDTFIYSNANIVRGLRDAASIATTLGQAADATDFTNRANGVMAGLNDKLDWNGEKSDISMIGVVYPFETHSPVDPRAARLMDRFNGVASDRFGNTHPLVRFPGQFNNDASDYVGLIDRYYGDGYWANGALGPTPAGPWFLTTMWYGMYYAYRADFTPGKADIDNHLFRLNRTADHNGPIGFGAEQMAPINSLQYPGQTDFTLQTAWPNAWESMSFYVDALMAFLDFTPDAQNNTIRIAPKLPTGWTTMTFNNVTLVNTPAGHTHKVDIAITEAAVTGNQTLTFTNDNGHPVNLAATIKLPPGRSVCSVRVNGAPASYTPSLTGVTAINTFALTTGAGSTTTLVVRTVAGNSPDVDNNGAIEVSDIFTFLSRWFAGTGDFDGNSSVEVADIFAFLAKWFAGCP